MDIRDFKEEPKPVMDGKYLEEIYSLQRVLIDKYVKIEGLPTYPVDVNTKPSQVLLKDFTGRVIEELAEGYESHIEAGIICDNNRFLVQSELGDKHINMLVNHLQNLNEEQADAMHFMAELLIFTNIQPDDIKSWIVKKMNDGGTLVFDDEDVLDMAMTLGYDTIMKEVRGNIHGGSCIDFNRFLTPEQEKYIRGGQLLYKGEVDTYDVSNRFLWAVTYALSISRNCLKNKPWKQSGVMTNETLYQSKIVEGFIYMCGYFRFLGMASSDVYYLYFKKNLANHFRIASKY